MNSPIPLRPDPARLQTDALRSILRAAVASGLAVLGQSGSRGSLGQQRAEQIVERRWPGDRVAELLLRAPVTPASLSGAGTAALQHTAFAFLRNLVPYSAAAAVLGQAVQLGFDGNAAISLPSLRAPAAGVGGFVQEGAPIRISNLVSEGGPMLEPFKFAVGAVLTAEMLNSSNAEELTRMALVDAAAAHLDAAFLSDDPGAAGVRPPGLFYNVLPLTPSAATANNDALADDIVKLLAAISPYLGSGRAALVGNVAQVAAIGVRTPRALSVSVFPTATMAPGSIAAVALQALVSANGQPVISSSRESAVHLEDTNPLPIVGSGSPGVVASPVASVFQIDSVAIKLRQLLSWTLRAPGAVALIENAKW